MNISTTSPRYYPIETYFCFVHLNNEMCMEILPSYSLNNEWGKPSNIQSCEIEQDLFTKEIDVVWLSICENRFYSAQKQVNIKYSNDNTQTLLIGMMPYGIICIWLYEEKKSRVIGCYNGEEVKVDMKDFISEESQIKLSEYCESRIQCNTVIKENLLRHGLHSRTYFENLMKQFIYRYQILLEKWKGESDKIKWQKYHEDETVPEFEFIEEALFDGTHDKLHDDELLKYHEAGKPKKLAIKWHIKKTEYVAYFWFEDERIREVFDKFYGAHPDTKTDFIIRIDTENKKYELALYRYGLKEPQVIPEDVYQLLVFKNKFEDYRSDNYDQERGAWIW
ncbi:hypothetical protein [Phocaeicola barnesiae]